MYLCTIFLFNRMEFLLGIAAGAVLSLFFSFGPAFFSLIQTSMQYGYRRAMFLPFGIFASDAAVVFLLLTVLKGVDMFSIIHNPYVASIGGAIMIIMGIIVFRKTVKSHEPRNPNSKPRIKFNTGEKEKPHELFVHGFLINFFNPLIWIYWLAIIALISGEMEVKTSDMYLFFTGLLGTTLGLDILKCKLAAKLQKMITAKLLNIFNKITGCIFFIFAGYLIISMLSFQLKDPEARDAQLDKERNQQPVRVIKDIKNGMEKIPHK